MLIKILMSISETHLISSHLCQSHDIHLIISVKEHHPLTLFVTPLSSRRLVNPVLIYFPNSSLSSTCQLPALTWHSFPLILHFSSLTQLLFSLIHSFYVLILPVFILLSYMVFCSPCSQYHILHLRAVFIWISLRIPS